MTTTLLVLAVAAVVFVAGWVVRGAVDTAQHSLDKIKRELLRAEERDR